MQITFTGTIATGNASITGVSSTTGLYDGQAVFGTGIPPGATILSISGSTVTLTVNATAAGTFTITAIPLGWTAVFAAKIQDGSGTLLANGRITFFPVSSPGGQPVSALASGGGLIVQEGVTFLIVAGAITTDLNGKPPQLADTSLTTPAHIGYRVTITDTNLSAEVEGPGLALVQPAGPVLNLDTYTPGVPVGTPAYTGVQRLVTPAGAIDGANNSYTFTGQQPLAIIFGVRNGLIRQTSEWSYAAGVISWTNILQPAPAPGDTGESHAFLCLFAS